MNRKSRWNLEKIGEKYLKHGSLPDLEGPVSSSYMEQQESTRALGDRDMPLQFIKSLKWEGAKLKLCPVTNFHIDQA